MLSLLVSRFVVELGTGESALPDRVETAWTHATEGIQIDEAVSLEVKRNAYKYLSLVEDRGNALNIAVFETRLVQSATLVLVEQIATNTKTRRTAISRRAAAVKPPPHPEIVVEPDYTAIEPDAI
jgi:hypothetical protein